MSFIRDLILNLPPNRDGARLPPFVKLTRPPQDPPADEAVKILKPIYSYDFRELDEIRDERLKAMDDVMVAKRRALMAQMIPGVDYETGIKTERGSTFIWARPVRVNPLYAPHVAAWGQVLTAAINQP